MGTNGRHGPLAQRDALSLLRAEHEMLLALFREYESLHASLARDDGRKAALAGRICRELAVHAALEEQAFYPAIAAAAGAQMLADALVEHEAQQLLASQLRSLYPDDPLFDVTLAALGEETRHHIGQEQDQLFDCARSCGLDLELLARDMARYRRAMAGPPSFDWVLRTHD